MTVIANKLVAYDALGDSLVVEPMGLLPCNLVFEERWTSTASAGDFSALKKGQINDAWWQSTYQLSVSETNTPWSVVRPLPPGTTVSRCKSAIFAVFVR